MSVFLSGACLNSGGWPSLVGSATPLNRPGLLLLVPPRASEGVTAKVRLICLPLCCGLPASVLKRALGTLLVVFKALFFTLQIRVIGRICVFLLLWTVADSLMAAKASVGAKAAAAESADSSRMAVAVSAIIAACRGGGGDEEEEEAHDEL